MLWLDQMKEAIARFHEFTHTLSRLSQIVPFMSISDFGNKGWGKSYLHTFDLRILYL